jgi:ubiquinol-cytochrome c reductase cytochrome c1 subunit
MSVLAKSLGVEDGFPGWLTNFFSAYSEGGPDMIHAILTGYQDPPADFQLPDGKFYNTYFPGHAIAMPPPLSDGQVAYGTGPNGETVPQTVDQYARDVSAFLMWLSEPHLVERKADGLKVILFLVLFAVLLYLAKRRIWSKAH